MAHRADKQADIDWLERIHQQWVATLDAIRDPVFVIGRDNTLLRANQAFAALAGEHISRIIGLQLLDVVNWLDERQLDVPESVVSSGSSQFRLRNVTKCDGTRDRVFVLEDVSADEVLSAAQGGFGADRTDSAIATLQAIARALEKKDPYTASHNKKVAALARSIALEAGHSDIDAQGVFYGALVHDIGKICIPSGILHRPGKLSPAEMNLIKMHPENGYSILKDLRFPWPVHDIVLQHHERLNGSGYPNGLKGPEISMAARIVAVADIAEAMTSHRPYRPALEPGVAMTELREGRGTLYCEEAVDAYLRLSPVSPADD